ncbi:MAG TPA: IclR family transcriptional regulator [Acidimicrobiales bacterium]|jgi:IclR family acetate operon transcriptional repressor|nr:IclR family transcriptional regulator [Acidimicrobiales bacterium]
MAATNRIANSSSMRSLERTFDILRILRQSRVPMRLTDIASESGIHLATTQRILSVMLQYGYVSQERYGYTVGVTSVMNAFSFHVTSSLNQITQPILQELTAASGLMSSLAIRVDFVQVMVLRVEGTAPLRYLLPVGEATPLYLGGARIFAAAMTTEEVAQLLEGVPEIRLASGQTVTEQEFSNSLKEIRDLGFVYSISERDLGSASVAVPVFSQEGTLEASLQVSGPAVELDEEKVEWCILELKRASAAITKRLP